MRKEDKLAGEPAESASFMARLACHGPLLARLQVATVFGVGVEKIHNQATGRNNKLIVNSNQLVSPAAAAVTVVLIL